MSEDLYSYYERELLFIRQLSQEFARQYPAAAGRLLLEPNRSTDPHVERLIEAFALLTGRIQHKLDPGAELPKGFLIDRHSRLRTQRVEDLPCKFRTGYPVTLWPVQVAS